MATTNGIDRITEILGERADDLLGHRCTTIPASRLSLPGPGFVDRVVSLTDRPIPVLRSLEGSTQALRMASIVSTGSNLGCIS